MDVTHSRAWRAILPVVLVVALVSVTLNTALNMGHDGGDYEWEAGPVIDALVRGNLHEFFAHHPLMGPLALWLRAPVVALVFHADVRVVYLVGVAVCLVPLFLVARHVARLLQARGRTQPEALAFAALLVVNPMVFRAIHWGHPEELGAVGTMLAAALAAGRRRPVLGGVLLGLALGWKQSIALAAVPIVFLAPTGRPKLALVAAGVTLAVYAPLAVGNFHRFKELTLAAGNPQALNRDIAIAAAKRMKGKDYTPRVPGKTHGTPANVEWPFATPLAEKDFAGRTVHAGIVSEWLIPASHLLAGALMLLLTWLFGRAGRRSTADILAVLAIGYLARCAIDPVNWDYYHLPFLAAVIAWEGIGTQRPPWLSLGAVLGLGIVYFPPAYGFTDLYLHSAYYNVAYLVWLVAVGTGVAALARTRRRSAVVTGAA